MAENAGDPSIDVDGTKRTDIEANSPSAHSESRLTSHWNEEADFVTLNEQRDLARGLHQRHISLIALAGAIVRNSQCLLTTTEGFAWYWSVSRSGELDSDRRASRCFTRLCDRWIDRLCGPIRAWRGDYTLACDWLIRPTRRVSDRSRSRLCYWVGEPIASVGSDPS